MNSNENAKLLKITFECPTFYYATKIILLNSKTEEWGPSLVFPLIVNSAFTCELSMKALLIKNSIVYGKEHALIKLFRKLPQDIQNSILSYLCAAFHNTSEENEEKIIVVSDYFVEVRYAAENSVAIDINFILCLMEALYKAVKKICGMVQIVPASEEENISVAEFDKKAHDYLESKIDKYGNGNTEK